MVLKFNGLVKILIPLALVAVISLVFYVIFSSLGLLSPEGVREFIESGNGHFVYLLYISLFVTQACCLSMIPGSTALFCGVGLLIFGVDQFWTVVILNIIGAWFASQALFLMGRHGGRRLIKVLFGENALDKQLNVLAEKGTKILPIWFLMLVLPDDLMSLACGASKINYKTFTILHTVFRSIGITLLTGVYFFVIPIVGPILGF
ncbi:MAG: VTT domain-containing protein [Methanomassiliicoccaceae archaeon]|nr:VTT domain-containing protein [Methanomassiliicoccaceae archaeon]